MEDFAALVLLVLMFAWLWVLPTVGLLFMMGLLS